MSESNAGIEVAVAPINTISADGVDYLVENHKMPNLVKYLKRNSVGAQSGGGEPIDKPEEIIADSVRVDRELQRRDATDCGREIINETIHVSGMFVVRRELVQMGEDNKMEMENCYNTAGDYIGNLKDANFLTQKRRIYPVLSNQNNSVCSIGYCPSDKKWYGWSHRAIAGFGIGDKIYEEDFSDDDKMPFIKHGRHTIKTLEQAKLAATLFAESVS